MSHNSILQLSCSGFKYFSIFDTLVLTCQQTRAPFHVAMAPWALQQPTVCHTYSLRFSGPITSVPSLDLLSREGRLTSLLFRWCHAWLFDLLWPRTCEKIWHKSYPSRSFKNQRVLPWPGSQLFGVLFRTPKRLQVRSLVRAGTRGNQSIFLSYIDASLSLTHALFIKSVNIFSAEG